MSADPLEDLVVDEMALAKEHLAKGLAPYVGLTERGEVVFTEAARQLTAAKRLLAVLLAMRAGRVLGLRREAGATPVELSACTGIPAGTVRPKLAELRRAHLVSKEGGRYVVPIASIRLAITALPMLRPAHQS